MSVVHTGKRSDLAVLNLTANMTKSLYIYTYIHTFWVRVHHPNSPKSLYLEQIYLIPSTANISSHQNPKPHVKLIVCYANHVEPIQPVIHPTHSNTSKNTTKVNIVRKTLILTSFDRSGEMEKASMTPFPIASNAVAVRFPQF